MNWRHPMKVISNFPLSIISISGPSFSVTRSTCPAFCRELNLNDNSIPLVYLTACQQYSFQAHKTSSEVVVLCNGKKPRVTWIQWNFGHVYSEVSSSEFDRTFFSATLQPKWLYKVLKLPQASIRLGTTVPVI